MTTKISPTGLPTDIRRLLLLGGVAVGGFLVFVAVWAIRAEITTTIRLPGVLSPTAPTYDVQHDRGGRIAEINVALHQNVSIGDLLFRLDIEDEFHQLAALEQRASLLDAELAAIAPRLDPRSSQVELIDSVRSAYTAQDAAFEAQLAQLEGEADGLSRRLAVLTKRQTAQVARLTLAQTRYDRDAELSEKGLLPKSTFEEAARALHDGEASLLALEAEAVEIVQRQEDVLLRQDRLTQDRREKLATTRLRHERELIETTARIARLRDTIKRANIYAPITGKVTELTMETEGLVVAPGATFAVLSQPVSDPLIDLYVPPAYIDQVRMGQEGLLTISALPQRTAPKLRVTLTQIALEPVRDQNGNSLHYLARASINGDDLAAAKADLGARFQLSVGMPVNAAMNGRKTTLWTFVAGPFTGLLGAAFED